LSRGTCSSERLLKHHEAELKAQHELKRRKTERGENTKKTFNFYGAKRSRSDDEELTFELFSAARRTREMHNSVHLELSALLRLLLALAQQYRILLCKLLWQEKYLTKWDDFYLFVKISKEFLDELN
jgi:hypothetical protein